MKIKTVAGMVLESSNPLVIEQWKKQGYVDIAATANNDKPADAGRRRKKE